MVQSTDTPKQELAGTWRGGRAPLAGSPRRRLLGVLRMHWFVGRSIMLLRFVGHRSLSLRRVILFCRSAHRFVGL